METRRPDQWTVLRVPKSELQKWFPRICNVFECVYSHSEFEPTWRREWPRGERDNLRCIDGYLWDLLHNWGHDVLLALTPADSDEPIENRKIGGFIFGGLMTKEEIAARKWMASRKIVPGMAGLRFIGVEHCVRTVRLREDLTEVCPREVETAHDTPPGRKVASVLHDVWSREVVPHCAEIWLGTQPELTAMWNWASRLGYQPLGGPARYHDHFGQLQRMVYFARRNPYYKTEE